MKNLLLSIVGVLILLCAAGEAQGLTIRDVQESTSANNCRRAFGWNWMTARGRPALSLRSTAPI